MGLLTHYSNMVEAGCDEAGRGCLAGPVVAAAVILKNGADYPELNDSKQLTEKKRMQLRELVINEALTYGIGVVSPQEIDEINILNASFLAMHRALDQLKLQPELLLIDGNRFNPYKKIKHICVVGQIERHSLRLFVVLWEAVHLRHRGRCRQDYTYQYK